MEGYKEVLGVKVMVIQHERSSEDEIEVIFINPDHPGLSG